MINCNKLIAIEKEGTFHLSFYDPYAHAVVVVEVSISKLKDE